VDSGEVSFVNMEASAQLNLGKISMVVQDAK